MAFFKALGFECPKCGTLWVMGPCEGGVKATEVPTCSMGHVPTEMEQILLAPEHRQEVPQE